jgi:hypothetical protein
LNRDFWLAGHDQVTSTSESSLSKWLLGFGPEVSLEDSRQRFRAGDAINHG